MSYHALVVLAPLPEPTLADYFRNALLEWAEDHPDEAISIGDAVEAFYEALNDALDANEEA